MRKFTFMFMAALLAALLFPVKSMAIDATWVAANQGYDNSQEVTEITIAETVKGVLSKADGNNAPKYYAMGTSLRLYAGNTLTITSTSEALTQISFTFDTNEGKKIPAFDVNTGKVVIADDGESGVWTGSATEIVFTVPNVSGTQSRIQSIILGEGGAEIVPDPVEPEGDLVTLPTGVTPEGYTLAAKGYAIYDDGEWRTYNVTQTIQVAFDGNDVYVQGLSYFFPEGWVKGTIEGKKAVFKSGQLFGSDETGACYFVGIDDDQKITDVVFDYNPETRVLTTDTYILEADSPNDITCYSYFYQTKLYPGEPVTPELVVLPEGVTAEEYHFKGYEAYYEDQEFAVQVAFNGNDVYMQGLSQSVPEAWVKGTLTDGQAVFGAQYMGIYESFFGDLEIYLNGATFAYDATKGVFSSAEGYTTTADDNDWDVYTNVTITKVVEREATPVAPTVKMLDYDDEYGYSLSAEIPLIDTEGNYLLSSKLSYQIYVEKDGKVEPYVLKAADYEYLSKDMTEIPYTFTDEWDIEYGGAAVYLYDNDITSWTKVGMKSIYTGGGQTHESAIGWLTIDWETLGVSSVNATAATSSIYFDLQGRQLSGAARGLVIKQVRMADGTTKSVKVVRK